MEFGVTSKKEIRKTNFIIYTFRNVHVWEVASSDRSAHHDTFPSMLYNSCGLHTSTQFLSRQINPSFSTAVFGTHIASHRDDCSVVDLYLPLWLAAVLISSKKTPHEQRGKKPAKTQLLPCSSRNQHAQSQWCWNVFYYIWQSKAWTVRKSGHVKKMNNPQGHPCTEADTPLSSR